MGAEHNLDRVPPYSEEAERGLLGCMLGEPLRVIPLATVTLRLKASHFYAPAHALLAETLLKMHAAGQAIDLLTVTAVLRDAGTLERVGGLVFLEQLAGDAVTPAYAEHYGQMVREKALARGVLARAQEIVESVYRHEKSGEQLLLEAPQKFTDIVGEVVREVPNIQIMETSIAAWRDAKAFKDGDLSKAPAIGLKTPFEMLTALTCGMEKGELIVLAGRPSAGKTTLEDVLATFVAEQGVPVARATMDSSHRSLLDRGLCRKAGVSLPKLKFGYGREDQLASCAEAAQHIAGLPMWINDQVQTVEEACAWAMMMAARRKIGLFTFDYLQLAGVSDTSRYVQDNDVARNTYIARKFKTLARQLDIPVLLLSQLSRNMEGDSKKGPRTPQLNDLRGSGEIEACADKVWFVYVDREKKAAMEDVAAGGRAGATKHKRPVWFEQAKYKNGELGRLPFWLHAPYFRFEVAQSNAVADFIDDALPGDADRVEKEYRKAPALVPQEEFVGEEEEK